MNRQEFLRQLESLLMNIPANEREDALAYYNDYFDEAENRELVIVLPRDMQLNEGDLEIAAALAHIDGILAKDVSVTIGAGQANISNIITDAMELEVGAGAATVSSLDAKEIEAKCGMGEVIVKFME